MASLTTTVLQPPMVVSVVAGLVYWRGSRTRLLVAASRPLLLRQRRCQAASFYAGLLVLSGAVSGPMDEWSDRLFWAHMGQHLLLVMVAAPLVVLGSPWLTPWRLLDQSTRVRLTRSVGHSPRWSAPRAVGRTLRHPLVSWSVFNVTLVGWHLPALYDLTLRNAAVHDLEHLMLLATAVLFWTNAVPSPPLTDRLNRIQQVGYLTSGALVGWLLALVFALAPHPLYAAYAQLHHGGGGLTALADQQLAAGMMWVPGSIPYSIAVTFALYGWLGKRPPSQGSQRDEGTRAFAGAR